MWYGLTNAQLCMQLVNHLNVYGLMMMMMTIDDDHPKGQVVAWNMDVKID